MDARKSFGAVEELVGKVIHDRFRIIAPIARGGMGAVYKAEQAPLGRLVAIKVLSPKHEEEKDPEFRKRFFLEAATVAKLTHPNTVTVFDYGQADGLYFIVMELIDGITLKLALKNDGAFPPSRAIHIAKQMCRSLREAHRLGIIHRDMKPGNVMLVEQGDEKDFVKVLDFGLVKDIEAADEEDLTQAGVFMGSPKYMSPEQIQGERVDGRSDIYSVGVLMYEMLTGAPPFVREKQVQILMDHINAPVPPPRTPPGHPPIPEELAHVVLRCLEKKREDRFPDMDRLLVTLKAVAGDLALNLPPSGELGTTGDYRLGRTPVSGIHTLSAEEMRRSTAGGIPAPLDAAFTPTTVSMHDPIGQVEPRRRGGLLGALFAMLFVGVAIALVLVLADPFDRDASPTAASSPSPPATPVANDREPTPSPIAAQPTPPQVAPAMIRSVMVDLDSAPPGAMVRIGEQEYGPTPAQVELTGASAEPGTELTFVFSAENFREMTITRSVPADGAIEVSARMRRRGGGGGARPHSPAGGEAASANQGGGPVTPAGYRESPY